MVKHEDKWKYEDKGLFIALVSYPFYMNGKGLAEKVFTPFFVEHKKKHLERFISGTQQYEDCLYNPACYRLIGTQGLAVFSLIDDYAFASRVFNLAHINKDSGVDYSMATKCHTVVITTSSEVGQREEETDGIEHKARATFLSKDKLYPFAAILRLKINCSFLDSKGLDLIHTIKQYFKTFKESLHLDYIATDSYDCDELVVSVFSQSLSDISVFADKIKKLRINDLFDTAETLSETNVFQACHLNYGYHPDFEFVNKIGSKFYEWESDKDDSIYVNLLIEPRCGHEGSVLTLIQQLYDKDSTQYSFLKDPLRTISGGGLLHMMVPIKSCPSLYSFTEMDQLRRYVRRAKLTLSSNLSESSQDYEDTYSGNEDIIDRARIDRLKELLVRSRVSKNIRERTLALVYKYNDLGRSSLQHYYFTQLKPAVESLSTIVDGLVNKNYPILIIERSLDSELSSLENAINDRISNNLSSSSVLEYGCGIQQLLHAFGFAYQKIYQFLIPKTDVVSYSFIVGMSKESSTRTHVELNINHIIYPQNFVTTIWKEASNYSFDAIRRAEPNHEKANENHDEAYLRLQIFYEFTRDRRFIENVLRQTIYEWKNDRYDVVYDVLGQLLLDETINLAKYLYSDILVFYYAFLSDYSLMWRSYFCVFLQTSSSYHIEDRVLMKPFVFMLLRLFLVAEVIKANKPDMCSAIDSFVDGEKNNPFSYALSDLWFCCFHKIRKASELIFSELSEQNYDETIYRVVTRQAPGKDDNFSLLLLQKCQSVVGQLKACEQIQCSNNVILDIMALFYGFIKVVDELSDNDKVINPDTIDPRVAIRKSNDGYLDPEYKGLRQVLPDPVGGYSIFDPDKRKKFFAYRTCFYRTLWHYSFASQPNKL